jgi:hypothetical protein
MTPYVLKELSDESDIEFALFNQVKHVVKIGLYMMEIIIGVRECSASRDMDTMKCQRSKWLPLCLDLLGTRVVGM